MPQRIVTPGPLLHAVTSLPPRKRTLELYSCVILHFPSSLGCPVASYDDYRYYDIGGSFGTRNFGIQETCLRPPGKCPRLASLWVRLKPRPNIYVFVGVGGVTIARAALTQVTYPRDAIDKIKSPGRIAFPKYFGVLLCLT